MKTVSRSILAALFGALLMTTTLIAQGPKGPHGGHHGDPAKMIEKISEKLQLSDQQKSQLEELKEEFLAEHGEDLERMRELRSEMHELRRSGDREAGVELRAEMKEMMQEMRESGMELRERLAEILTEEQLAELKGMREKHRRHLRRQLHDGKDCEHRGEGARHQTPGETRTAPAPRSSAID